MHLEWQLIDTGHQGCLDTEGDHVLGLGHLEADRNRLDRVVAFHIDIVRTLVDLLAVHIHVHARHVGVDHENHLLTNEVRVELQVAAVPAHGEHLAIVVGGLPGAGRHDELPVLGVQHRILVLRAVVPGEQPLAGQLDRLVERLNFNVAGVAIGTRVGRTRGPGQQHAQQGQHQETTDGHKVYLSDGGWTDSGATFWSVRLQPAS